LAAARAGAGLAARVWTQLLPLALPGGAPGPAPERDGRQPAPGDRGAAGAGADPRRSALELHLPDEPPRGTRARGAPPPQVRRPRRGATRRPPGSPRQVRSPHRKGDLSGRPVEPRPPRPRHPTRRALDPRVPPT